MTSGPTSTVMAMSESGSRGELWLQETEIVFAESEAAY